MQYLQSRGMFSLVVQAMSLLLSSSEAVRLPPSVRRPPSIVDQAPEIYYALPEAKIMIKCAADAMPSVQSGEYYWKKDGVLFNTSEEDDGNVSVNILMSKTDGSLHFNGSERLQSDDLLQYEGKYQCFARSKWGTALSNEIDLRIGTMAPFAFPANEKRTVTRGQSLEVSCHENVTDDVEIKWNFDSESVQPSPRIAQTSDGTIIFSNVEQEDNNHVIYCALKYLPTRSSIDATHYTLSVTTDDEVADRIPTIVRPKENEKKVALLREDILLTCIATGKPTPSISWTRKGLQLHGQYEDDRDRFEMIDFNRTLRIANVKYADAGTYTCTAQNEEGLRRRDIIMTVEAKPYFSKMSKRPYDMIAVPGNTVSVRCEPDGKPAPEVVWMQNGKLLGDSVRGRVSKNLLLLKDITEEETGVYQCVGKNVHGTIMAQGFLNVLVSPPIPFPDNKMIYRKVEKTTVVLGCEMFSSPPYFTNWTKSIQPQRNLLWSRRIKLREDKALQIEKLNLDDGGTYICNATNNFGSATLNISLLVLGKTIVQPINQKEIYYEKKGNDVTMAVDVNSDNYFKDAFEVSWSKDGYPMGKGLKLSLLAVTLADGGKYDVFVETELDKAETVIELVVQDVPEKPINLVFNVDEHDPYSVTLNWEGPYDNNSPVLSYEVDQYAFTETYRGKWEYLTVTPDGTETRISLSNLEPWVTYRFRVWAENLIGRSNNASLATEPYRTPSAAPHVKPTGVSGKGTAPDNMIISWDPVDPLKYAGPGFGYEVRWCLASNCTWEETFCTFDVTSHAVNGTQPYTRYWIQVTAANDVNSGPKPDAVVGYSGEDVPLKSPSDVRHLLANDSKVEVSWKPVPASKMRGLPTGYVIRAKEVNSDKIIQKKVSPDEVTAEIQLDPFTKYEITVAVSNNAGESKPSSSVTITTPEGLPDAPEDFIVSKYSLTKLRAEWKQPTKVKGRITLYRLNYTWLDGNETKSVVRTTKTRKMKLTELQQNTSYSLALCAKTSIGFGRTCAKLQVSTLQPREPRQPVVVIDMDQYKANVTWEISPQDVDEGIKVRSYQVQHRMAGKDDEKWISSDAINASTWSSQQNYTVPDLVPATLYEFRVVAVNEHGQMASNATEHRTDGVAYRKSGGGIAGKLWWIAVLCIVALIILIIAIACFVRQRRGGKYAVSEKEEQLVKFESQGMTNNDCGKYSPSNTEAKEANGQTTVTDGPGEDRPLRLRGDSVGGNSIEVFGSGDTREYDEDGSFIDQYGDDRRSHSKSDGMSSPGTDETKDVADKLLSGASGSAP